MEPSKTVTGEGENPELDNNQIPIASFPESNYAMLLVFSYLAGCDLFQKIAVTSK
jgi:hypothetical protein